MPSSSSIFTAFIPSFVIGIFTTTLSPSSAKNLPSFTMPSVSKDTVSKLTGPSTKLSISFTTSMKGLPVLAANVGFVVTPSSIPQSIACFISSTFAVSIKNCIIFTSSWYLFYHKPKFLI